jgi:glucoamylase
MIGAFTNFDFKSLTFALSILSSAKALIAPRQTINIDTWIASESPIAKAGILANIGPDGAKDGGANSGVVIASPSTSNPDYLYVCTDPAPTVYLTIRYSYTWTRDSALVYKLLIDQYTEGRDSTLLAGIDNWVASQGRIQQVSNPSGTVSTGGLGEPKYLINESAFTGGWG